MPVSIDVGERSVGIRTVRVGESRGLDCGEVAGSITQKAQGFLRVDRVVVDDEIEVSVLVEIACGAEDE